MTQHDLTIEYIKEFGSILPAKMAGVVYKGLMFGSETSKRCRELRTRKLLLSSQEGKFERFYLNPGFVEERKVERPKFDLVKWNASFKRVEVKVKQTLF